MQDSLPDANETAPKIAVVGLAGRFPGARTTAELWRNLCGGVESVSSFTIEELTAAGIDPRLLADPRYVRAKGVLADADLFDAVFFGYTPREAEHMDPQHRVFLECAWEALEDAGCDPQRYRGRAGVYAGCAANTYLLFNLLPHRELMEKMGVLQLLLLNDRDFLATRVSYKLDLRGPSVAVQTACSTSLVAIHMACQALLTGECDLALAGGVSISTPLVSGYLYQEGSVLSPDGRCRAFDAGAAGAVEGNGCGVVMLKRLADALADGDRIRAVIRGSAVTNDGASRVGFTAPSVEGQAAAISEALLISGVDPDTIGYVETHGSGTPLGDPIEMEALTQAFRRAGARSVAGMGSCAIGSVKTNLGHCNAAAGVAGFLKAVLALENRTLPPSLNFERPNPRIDFAASPFRVATACTPWEAAGAPRRAGVSAFGLGGTNAHVVLEEAPAPEPGGPPSRPAQLLVLSARTPEALDAATVRLAEHLEAAPPADLADVAWTLQTGRRGLEHRRAVVARDREAAVAALRASVGTAPGFCEEPGRRSVVFLFPGLGDQSVDMARELYETEPVFRGQVDLCAGKLKSELGCDLREVLFSPDAWRPSERRGPDLRAMLRRDGPDESPAAARLRQTVFAQPACFVVESALARLLMHWGVMPQAMIGYSIGEYTAACLAGVLSLDDALLLVARRAWLIQDLPQGAMLAVPLAEEAVRPLLEGRLSVCATNGPHFCVVGGPEDAVGELERELAGRGTSCIRLQTTHAFHSSMMEPAAAALTAIAIASTIEAKPPRIPYLSNVTGTWITQGDVADPAYWSRHMLGTVRFAEGLGALLRESGRVYLEIGPGATLGTLVRQHPDAADAAADLLTVPTLGRGGDTEDLLAALGRLWEAGVEIDWERFHGGERRLRVSLPTYPFERQRFWIDPPRAANPHLQMAEAGTGTAEVLPASEGSVRRRPGLSTPYVAPRNETEESLAIIWQDLFGFAPIGVEDSFLELGGQSLLAIQVIAQIQAAFGITLTAAALFEAPTVAGLAAEVARARGGETPEEDGTPAVPPVVLIQPPPVARRSGPAGLGDWPLSFDQERLLQLHLDDPELVAWNVDAGSRVLGPLHVPAFAGAFAVVIRRHAAWRTTFPLVDGRRVQRVAPWLAPETSVIDLTALPAEVREPVAHEALRERARAVFDLERGPLVRIALARLAAEEHLCQLTVHHLVTDWITFQHCWREVLALYEAHRAGRTPELPPLPLQYPDYVLWEREWLRGEVLEEHADFWRRELAGFPLALELPTDRPRPPVHRQRGGLFRVGAGAPRTDRLRELGRREGATMFMTMLAVMYALLHRFSGHERIVVGSNSANRARPELEPLFGFFLTQVPFAADLAGDPTFRELLGRVRRSALSSYAHQNFPFSKLIEALRPAPDPSRSPVVQVLLLVLEGQSRVRAGDLEFQAVPLFDGNSRWDLTFGLYDYHDVGLAGPLEYNADVFENATVGRLLELFYRLIDAVTEDPGVRLSQLPALSATAERQALRQERRATIPRVSGPEGAGEWPLSFDQERLWFLSLLDPQSTAYNMTTATRLLGGLDVPVLAWSLNEVLRRHAAWRATFPAVEGSPVQRIAAEIRLPLPVVDLSALPTPPDTARATALAELVALAARQPFALDRGPLLRVSLLRLGEREHVCLLAVHHIASDWVTLQLFWSELAALYPARLAGRPAALPDLPIQYPDFVLWQRHRLQGEVLSQQLAWWVERLRGFPLVLDLPADRPRPATESMRGGRHPIRLEAETTGRLREVSRREGTTRFMTITALCAALFHRLSGQEKLVLGTLNANRSRPELQPLFGFLLTQLPLAVDLAGDPPFRELLARVRRVAVEAYAHPDLPFGKLVEALHPERELGRMPVVQTLVQLIESRAGAGGQSLSGLRLEPLDIHDGNARYDLMFSLFEDTDSIHGPLEYNAEIFEATTAARFLETFLAMAAAAAADPSLRVSELPAFSEAAGQQVLLEWNDTAAEASAPATVVDLFEAQAARTPEAVAWTGDGWSLTYAELDERSGRLARHLRRLGAGPETLVGIYLERTVELPVALLGVLRSGAAYLPLDVAHPAERRAFLLEDAGAALVLTQERLLSGLPAGVRAVCLDSIRSAIAGEPAAPPRVRIEPESRAYVIYTSGSTGAPKGAEIPHRALAHFVRAMRRLYTVATGDVMPAITTTAFDLSVPELYLPMLGGGTTPLLGRDTAADGALLARVLDARGATVLQATPATYRMLLESGWPGRPELLLLCGAEPLHRDLADRLLPLGRGLWNFYGPTETTVWSTAWRVEDRGPISIGRPIAETQVYLLDHRLAPVPPGAIGEICIGGAGLARGYLRRPGLTAERFVPNPFSRVPGARLYRTGDLGRYRPDGRLDHLGRADHQVKLRGFRIEPGEIEAALRGHPAVAEAVVMLREDRPGDPRLVAWLERAPGAATPSAAELREHLRRRLPDYMVPAAFVPLPALPRNANGKLDRRALPAPERLAAPPETGHVAPRDEAEADVAAIWQRLLGVDRVGVNDDFFELGGHSLLANRILAAVRDHLGAEIPLRAFFQAPTVAGVAAAVRLEKASADAGGLPRIERQPRRSGVAERFPVSFSQLREWILDRLEPGTPAYNVPAPVRVAGPLSIPLLAASLQEMVRRHESLRTTFEAGPEEPLQVVAPRLNLPVPVIDLEALPELNREPELQRLLAEDLGLGFDLAAGPLLRARVVRLGPEDHAVFFTIHHIVSDGWSIGVFLRELGQLYEAFSQGRPARLPPLPELAVQYPDYAVWQRQRLRGEALDEQVRWWRGQLAGAPPLLELPTDRPRPPVRSSRGAELPVALPRSLAAPLQALAARQGASLFAALLAAFQALLARLSGQEDVCAGTFASNRPRTELEGLIGFFVNTLVLRTDLSGDPSYLELIARVREVTLGVYAHQEIPFEKLLEALDVPRDPSRTPLFQVMLVLQSFPRQRLELSQITLTPLPFAARRANFDLTLWLTEGPDGLGGYVDYSPDLFEEATVARMMGHLRTLLEGAVADPECGVRSLPLLAPAERAEILEGWSRTAEEPPGPPLLHRLVEVWAARTPWAAAVETAGGERLTYAELDARADRLARRLRRLGVGPEARVGLAAERSLEMLVGMLAILKAGGAYVPLDPAYPRDRLAFMLEDSGAAVLLAQEHLVGRMPAGGARLVLLDGAPLPEDDETGDAVLEGEVAVDPDHPAYVIYTSGSTGRPKGVVVAHRSIAAYVRTAREHYAIGPADRVLQLGSISFDTSLEEIYPALAAGATVVLRSADMVLSMRHFLRELDRLGITLLALQTAFWHEIVAGLVEGLALPGTMRLVAFGGEAALVDRVEAWRRHVGPGVRLVNTYGPTEATIVSTYRELAEPEEDPEVPIGRPVPGARLYVVDPRFEPMPPGVAGELMIGGAGLARGYLGRPDLTAERFVPDPFGGVPGARLYQTGDLVRFRDGGDLLFCGRADRQLKLRGYRIEPGEIEAALRLHPALRDAVADLRGREEDKRLVAWVVAREGTEAPGTAELRAFLRDRLPEPMVPSLFVPVPALPLTPSGKLDRRALPEPEGLRPAPSGHYTAPASALERTVAGIFAELLRVDRVGRDDNFFDLGGHSLLVVRAHQRLRQALRREIPVVDLFRFPTVALLARHLGRTEDGEDDPFLQRLQILAGRRKVARSDHIAILGMAGRFPGARNVEELWARLREGVDCIRDLTDEDLRESGLDPAALPAGYVRRAAVVDDIELFDAAFFGCPEEEAEILDPQLRLFLECAWEALESAAWVPDEARPEQVGVFAGTGLPAYLMGNLLPHPRIQETVDPIRLLLANDRDYFVSRVAYELDLRGPALGVQTASSTSLAAVHLACQSLLSGQCTLAIAGGVRIAVPQKAGYVAQDGLLPPDGRCRAFDARGRGTLSGSGVAVVVLKRLEDALADGDPIHAVIRGFACNNDGALRVGYTAPSVEGQAEVIALAQAMAEVDPETIGYVEAHGSGTPLGDTIEVAALTRAFRAGTQARGFCALGSIKTNVGHLESAAGAAGLIKAALAVERGEIPPSLHFETPNPEIDFASGPFYVNTRLREWPRRDDLRSPRRAGVSSFGMGGTNVHLILEEAPEREPPGPARLWQLLVLSARTASALERRTDDLADWLEAHPCADLADVAHTLQIGRRAFPHRRALVCRGREDALEALRSRDPLRLLDGVASSQPGSPMAAPILPAQDQQEDRAFLLGRLARLWVAGQTLDWAGLADHERRRRLHLPTHPFERKRYWIDAISPGVSLSLPQEFLLARKGRES